MFFLGIHVFFFQAFTPHNEESGRELNPDSRSAAYFSQNDFSYLSINPIGTSLVVQSIQCALTCLQHLSCFSFNLAAFPDDNGKLLCEHLSSDKYNNSEKFVASNTYHHFSIWVSHNKETLKLSSVFSFNPFHNDNFTDDCLSSLRRKFWRSKKQIVQLFTKMNRFSMEYGIITETSFTWFCFSP